MAVVNLSRYIMDNMMISKRFDEILFVFVNSMVKDFLEKSLLLLNPNVHYHIHKSLPLDPILH